MFLLFFSELLRLVVIVWRRCVYSGYLPFSLQYKIKSFLNHALRVFFKVPCQIEKFVHPSAVTFSV